jgi:ribosomal-protein-alanine N-acetyltransferase
MFAEISKLHQLCFPDKPWSVEEFAGLKKSGCEIIASENGFIVWRCIADECEIITIGVAPNARGGGVASAMLTLMEKELLNNPQEGRKIILEVSEDNLPARKLYEKHGFRIVGRRPKYYDGVIDAVVMEKRI